jgi:NAD(P)-dependent dehydrogenase (short-subunit alcohol dehydrogenase family)
MNSTSSTHPLDLNAKVAVVTGGNRGIGLGIAQGLASAGCSVAIWGRDEAQNRKAVEQCSLLGSEVAAFHCDVLVEASVQEAMASTLTRFGRVDGLFANAGIGGGDRTPFLEQTDDDWQRMLSVNLLGVKHASTAALRHMVDRARRGEPGGRVVVTASTSAILGAPFNQHYAATKAGLVALTRAIAVEFGRHGVTANALMPGFVQTEMIGELMNNEKFMDIVQARLPSRRFGEARDFAGIAIYLMSDLSSHHTGDAFTIDGGFSIS